MRNYSIPNVSRAVADVYGRFFGKERITEFPAIQGKKIAIQKSQLLQDFKANLETFIDICRHRQIIPVLMTQANRFSDDPGDFIASMMQRLEIQHGITYNDFKEIFDLFNEQIRMVGKANNVLVIDLANHIPQEKKYLYDTVHLTTGGARLASQVILQNLRHLIQDLAVRKNHTNVP
jgi:hydroxypyruvate isomerase